MSVELKLENDSIDVLVDAIIFTLANAPSVGKRLGEIAINEADYTELERIRDLLEASYLND